MNTNTKPNKLTPKKLQAISYKLQPGFTLIELLVVISVIGLLASVILVSLNSARGKARDARRRADLRQISTAMELYYDKFDSYVVTGYGYNGLGIGWFAIDGAPNTVAKGLADQGFLSGGIIDDPDVSKRPGYMIYPCNNGQSYSISATLENPTAADIAHVPTVCNGSNNPPGNTNGLDTNYGKNLALP